MKKIYLALGLLLGASAFATNEELLENATINNVTCKTIKGEVQQGDPDAMPERLPDTYQIKLSATHSFTEEQQGDPSAPVEKLHVKDKKAFQSYYSNKNEFEEICDRLKVAKKSGLKVNLFGSGQNIQDVNTVLLKDVTVESIDCKKIKGEAQQGDPGAKLEFLPDSFEVKVKVSFMTVEEQQGDAHSSPEQLRYKENRQFDAAFQSRYKQEQICKKLKEAKKKGNFVDILGWNNEMEDIKVK